MASLTAPPPAPALVDELDPDPEPESVRAEHLIVDRTATVLVTVVPFVALALTAVFAWGHFLHWTDLVVALVMYTLTGLGITVGFHRLFTHRAFACRPWLRFVLAALGTMALEGPVIEWVANHRQHHRFSDHEGDPHSPHLHGPGLRGALAGLAHAHIGWVVTNADVANERRYAPDLLADRAVKAVDSTDLVWDVASLALPFGFGVALTGTATGGLTALLWGGAVRLALLHHVTFSINSLCHFFGKRPYETGDESRNLAWLSLLSFGESWHNNHHAFPTSAKHGLRRTQVDLSALTIAGLRRVGLAWDVVSISDQRLASKTRS
ncbi:MAG: acyl-CoA desaturase [Solirubrobacteraceae bacterium]|nr:acyl-CoA desaturase [Solirubrobacteraceae bacterium]